MEEPDVVGHQSGKFAVFVGAAPGGAHGVARSARGASRTPSTTGTAWRSTASKAHAWARLSGARGLPVRSAFPATLHGDACSQFESTATVPPSRSTPSTSQRPPDRTSTRARTCDGVNRLTFCWREGTSRCRAFPVPTRRRDRRRRIRVTDRHGGARSPRPSRGRAGITCARGQPVPASVPWDPPSTADTPSTPGSPLAQRRAVAERRRLRRASFGLAYATAAACFGGAAWPPTTVLVLSHAACNLPAACVRGPRRQPGTKDQRCTAAHRRRRRCRARPDGTESPRTTEARGRACWHVAAATFSKSVGRWPDSRSLGGVTTGSGAR